MKCYKHPDRDAVGICAGCGNPICQECNVRLDKDNFCKECKDNLAAAREKKQTSKNSKWVIGLLIGCGSFLFLAFIGGILAAMLIPALSRARDQAKRAVCSSNLKQIGLGLQMYAVDYNDRFPHHLSYLYPEYIPEAKVFWCPSDPDDSCPQNIKTPEDALISYRYVTSLSPDDDPGKPIVYEDLKNHKHKGGNILFIDGHVEWKNADEFKKLIPESYLESEYETRVIP